MELQDSCVFTNFEYYLPVNPLNLQKPQEIFLNFFVEKGNEQRRRKTNKLKNIDGAALP